MVTRSSHTITPVVASATATPSQELAGDTLGTDAAALKQSILRHLEYTLAELPRHVDSEWEPYVAVALTARDRLIQRWIQTQDAYYDQDPKRIYYLSLELGLLHRCRERVGPCRGTYSKIFSRAAQSGSVIPRVEN